MDKINAGVPFSCRSLRSRRAGSGEMDWRTTAVGFVPRRAVAVGRLSFFKKKKKGRKRVGEWWGGSVALMLHVVRGGRYGGYILHPNMRYRGIGELEEEIKFVLESVTVKRPPICPVQKGKCK